VVTLGEQRTMMALTELPHALSRISGFLELIEANQRQQIAATDAQTAAIKDLAEAVYTLAHLQAAQSAGEQPGLDHINAATRMWLAERDQPDLTAKENP
jgi:hypothetical protein